MLRPYLDAGIGLNDGGVEDLWAFGVGLRTEFIFPWRKWELGLEPRAQFSITRSSDGIANEDIAGITGKMDARYPLSFLIGGKTPDAGVYFQPGYYPDGLEFNTVAGQTDVLHWQFELGVTLGCRSTLQTHPGELPVESILAHFGSGCTNHTGRGHIDILKLEKWGTGRLIGFSAVVFLLASLVAIVPTALILDKSVQLDDGGTTVFISFEGHPECGAVLEYVNSADLEAGDIVSGDPRPCESRNLIIRIVQVVLVLALFGLLFYVAGTWLMVGQKDEETPDPA